ncbi:MAG: hypoxanthine phosphoribosyltransferase [Mycoplasma sp.]|nr:hypoxanthine phosphoribosyltransferase [Mycoplasma sp.]
MNTDIKEIIITEEQIKERVLEIAKKIDENYKEEPIVLLGLLKGSFSFLSDLSKKIKNPNVEIEFIVVKSYLNGKSTNNINIVLDLKKDIKDKNIILIEDIVDTGRTLSTVKKIMQERSGKKVEIVSLCSKTSQRVMAVEIDYPTFEIPNEIVVGCGLDYNEKYRHLPYVASLTKEALDKYKKGEN